MAFVSSPDVLVLHALRIMGMADHQAVADRFELDPRLVEEALLDDEARGLVQQVGFVDIEGWTLTERGHGEHGRRVAAELAEAGEGATAEVAAVHARFIGLNGRLLRAVTDWQLRPTPNAALAANDHSDEAWDRRVLDELEALETEVRPLGDALAALLDRFAGYPDRLRTALTRVRAGDPSWVDRPRVDSFHTIWFELHEDLLATLGLRRGEPASGSGPDVGVGRDEG